MRKAEIMNSAVTNHVLRRKVAAGREDHFSRAMSVPKALRLTAPKVADELFDLPLGVIGVSEKTVSQADVAAQFSDGALLVLLDGPDGRTGAAVLSADLVDAIIQQQTMGKVTAASGDPREMTRTDAAMVAPFLDALLERSAVLPEVETDRFLLGGFKFGARADDDRMLGLALDAAQFRVLNLSFDLARGVRQGDLLLCMPLPDLSCAQEAEPDSQNGGTLHNIVLNIPADLTAVLCKLRRPLSELGAFQVGDTITIPRSALKEAGLFAVTGRRICQGQLGQSGGFRALRLTLDGRAGSARALASNVAESVEAVEISANNSPPDPQDPEVNPMLPSPEAGT